VEFPPGRGEVVDLAAGFLDRRARRLVGLGECRRVRRDARGARRRAATRAVISDVVAVCSSTADEMVVW